ncbi:antibiotic acetyltransferase [bacterium]|nr:antibiotic acetyltransferase [bacterium]
MKVGNSDIVIGRFTYGHRKMVVREWGEGATLRIGQFCSIATQLTVLLGGNHRTDWATTFPFGRIFKAQLGDQIMEGQPYSNGDVTVGNDVWFGRNVTVMSGVTIGDGAVIAANATVVGDIGPYEIWGGNPAKLLRKRFDDAIIAELLALKWWDAPVGKIREISAILSSVPDRAMLDTLRAILAG